MPPNNQQQPNQMPAPAAMPPADGLPMQQPGQPQMYAPQQPGQHPSATQEPPKTTKKQVSTQDSLLLSELRENMVIMADGSFRAVVACKSINFDLMSSREREGVEFSYQNFLNALYFPIQILVRSQRVDIGPYIDKLETIRRAQDNMLLNVLMDDYIQFIDVLSQEANIMDKSFFVAIPYYPTGDLGSVVEKSKGLFGGMFSKNQSNAITKIDKNTYEKAKEEINNRVESVVGGLLQVGVQAVQLNTKELGELYYNVYNPDTAVREPLGDFTAITSTYVRKGDGQTPPPYAQGGMM